MDRRAGYGLEIPYLSYQLYSPAAELHNLKDARASSLLDSWPDNYSWWVWSRAWLLVAVRICISGGSLGQK